MSDFRLKVFRSVAKNLSFTKASQELFVSQPAITKHIQELEAAYQTRIIRKSKFPQNPKRSVRFSGKRTKRSVQKRKARNTQKAETKVL